MPTNSKDYQREYMKKYNEKKSTSVTCEACGGKYKEYSKYIHYKTNKHQYALLNNINEVRMSKTEYQKLMEKLEAIERKYDSSQNGYDEISD